MFKKILAISMSLTIIMTSGTMTALAEGGLIVHSDSESVESIESTDNYGVIAAPDEGSSSASIEVTNDVSVNNEVPAAEEHAEVYGAVASSNEDGEQASVTIGGDVTVNNDVKDYDITTGVHSITYGDDTKSSVTVGGDINVTSSNAANQTSGITSIADGTNSKSSVTAEGNVSVNGSGNRIYGIGALSYTEDSTSSVHVSGDVTAESTGEGIACGIFAGAYGGNVDITLEKDLTVKGDDNAVGIVAVAEPEIESENYKSGSADINIGGDVTSTGIGMALSKAGGEINIAIGGTLKTEADAILLEYFDEDDPNEGLNITVWKIESGNDQIVGVRNYEEIEGDYETVSEENRKKVEESINYIIRIDENQKSKIALSNTRTISNMDTARQDETVYVKLNIPEGYRLLGAYSDAERNVRLQWNSENGYYLSVPRGGGVTVCLSLSEIENYYDNDSGDDSSNKNPGSYIGSIPITTLSDDDYKFDEITGALTISIPSGTSAFNLDSSVILAFITQGMKTLCLEIAGGPKYSIPVENLQDLLQVGNVLTFVLGDNKVDIFIAGIYAKTFTPVES